MKTCTACGQEKRLGEFHRSNRSRDGHKSKCKLCRSASAKLDYAKAGPHWRARYERQRAFMDELKAKPCADCEIEYPPAVMQFHHLYGKTIEVAKLFNRTQDAILTEIEKCVVLCANCHIMRHVNERSPSLLEL
jgi:hypothetical protein